MNILMIALNNIKKRKSTAIILTILISAATMFFYIGTTIMAEKDSFFEKKVKELNGSYFSVLMPSGKGCEEAFDIVRKQKYVEDSEVKECVFAGQTDIQGNRDKCNPIATFLNIEEKHEIGNLIIIDKGANINKSSIVVPYLFKSGYGYKTGDKLTFKSEEYSRDYEIYGFYEDSLMYNSSASEMFKFYVPNETFQELKGAFSKDGDYRIINTKTDKVDTSEKIKNEYSKDIKKLSAKIMAQVFSAEDSKSKSSINIGILISILLGFSIVIILVSIVVSKFSITVYMEEQVKNIGVLKTLGYVGGQIQRSVLLQFLILSVLGAILGGVLGVFLMPLVGNIIASSIGLMWSISINFNSLFISTFSTIFLTMLIVMASSVKLRKIEPIVAVREGITNHNFKKSPIELEKSKGNLDFLLGVKSIIFHIKQNITIVAIVVLLTFVTILSSVLYYNFVDKSQALLDMLGISGADLVVVLKNTNINIEEFKSRLLEEKGVEQVQQSGDMRVNIKDIEVKVDHTENFQLAKPNTIIEGRNPKQYNEIVLNKALMKRFNKSIDDSIKVRYNDVSKDYIIVGVSQGIDKNVKLTKAAMQLLNKDYNYSRLNVYLKEGINNGDFITMINDKYKSLDIVVGDIDLVKSDRLKLVRGAMDILILLISIITIVVVSMVLFMIIKIRILKEKINISIYKALGYTCNQLINQITYSIVPVITFGVICGTVLGVTCVNSLMEILLNSLGIFKAVMLINYGYVGVAVIGIIVISYLITVVTALRLRKISPCEMVR